MQQPAAVGTGLFHACGCAASNSAGGRLTCVSANTCIHTSCLFGVFSAVGLLFHLLLADCPAIALLLQLYARLNDRVFRDELLWDVANPQNTPDTYAMRVCGDLGLGCDWYDAIKGHLESRLQEVRQVGFRACRKGVWGNGGAGYRVATWGWGASGTMP